MNIRKPNVLDVYGMGMLVIGAVVDSPVWMIPSVIGLLLIAASVIDQVGGDSDGDSE